MTRVRAFAVVAVVSMLALLLAGCSTPDVTPVQVGLLRVPISGKLAQYYGQTPEWKTCADGDTCASVRVPLDWSRVSSKSISIALVKHAATGTSIGSLVMNPGGPGGSGVELVEKDLAAAFDPTIIRNYDVIGFDPRGVGLSQGVTCESARRLDDYLYTDVPGAIGSRGWVAGEEARSKAMAAACQKQAGALLGHVDTVEAAQDLDIIRDALGEAKLNYFGYSYGTYLGTIYAGLHPNRVGRTVFDGAYDPWFAQSDYVDDSDVIQPPGSKWDFNEDGALLQAMGFEEDLTDYLTACVAEDSKAVGNQACPFGTTVHSAKLAVISLLNRVTAHPIAAADGRKLDGEILTQSILSALYSPSKWPTLTRLFAQVKTGDPTIAFEAADAYNRRLPNGTYTDDNVTANLAVRCLENGPRVDFDFDAAQFEALKLNAPVLGRFFAYGDLTCSGWKYGPSTRLEPIEARGAEPIVVVGTTRDPATPFEDAEALVEQLDNAKLVTFNGDGHTAYNRGNSCVNNAVDDFLVHGTVPATDPDCS